jgi:hypothetical protein
VASGPGLDILIVDDEANIRRASMPALRSDCDSHEQRGLPVADAMIVGLDSTPTHGEAGFESQIRPFSPAHERAQAPPPCATPSRAETPRLKIGDHPSVFRVYSCSAWASAVTRSSSATSIVTAAAAV